MGALKYIDHVTATLALHPEYKTFQVVGEAIRNISVSDDRSKEIPSETIDTNTLHSLLLKWRNNTEEPIIRTYGAFCLEQSGLAWFKFLLSIEALEAEYDSIHKNEIETEKQKSQENIKILLEKLDILFTKDDTHRLKSQDRRTIKQAVKNSQKYTTLACKLRTLCNTKPWIKARLEENPTIKRIIKENNQKKWDAFDSLAAIRNWLSHGDKKDMRDGFPDLVNVVESWCRSILFEVLGAPEEVIQKVSDFYGWKPVK